MDIDEKFWERLELTVEKAVLKASKTIKKDRRIRSKAALEDVEKQLESIRRKVFK